MLLSLRLRKGRAKEGRFVALGRRPQCREVVAPRSITGMKCPQCHDEVPHGRFCDSCGKPLPAAEALKPPSPVNPVEPVDRWSSSAKPYEPTKTRQVVDSSSAPPLPTPSTPALPPLPRVESPAVVPLAPPLASPTPLAPVESSVGVKPVESSPVVPPGALRPATPPAPLATPTPVATSTPVPDPDLTPPPLPRPTDRGNKTVMIGSSRPVLPTGVPTCRLVAKQYGKETSTTFPLHGSVVVGRFDPATGPVDVDLSGLVGSEHVSRHHAKVEPRGSQWVVRDMQSANGIFVRKNGTELFGPRLSEAELRDGDEIAFGQVVVVFRVGGG
jgi:hypothetical protein